MGVSKGTIQTELFLQWEKEHNVKTELIALKRADELMYENKRILKEKQYREI